MAVTDAERSSRTMSESPECGAFDVSISRELRVATHPGRRGRGWRLLIASLLAPLAIACRATPLAFPDAPVVLVSIDTLRADHLPAYGYSRVETPHLDRFRKDAVLFASAWSPSPMTLPSHVSMLTGLLPPEHGVRNNVGYVFDGKAHASLPRLLEERGYATGAAVSSYVLRRETGLGALFGFYEDSLEAPRGQGVAEMQRPGGVTARRAAPWLDERGTRPFFFLFHIYEPHVPYDPPEPFRSRFAHPYDGEIAAADAIVGELLDRLRARGLYDRSIVIVTSDHGEGLGDHGEDQHSILLYVEAVRVPLLVKLPRSLLAGRTVETPAGLVDIAPTVLDLLGIDRPLGGRGVSLRRLVEGDAPERTLYGETLIHESSSAGASSSPSPTAAGTTSIRRGRSCTTSRPTRTKRGTSLRGSRPAPAPFAPSWRECRKARTPWGRPIPPWPSVSPLSATWAPLGSAVPRRPCPTPWTAFATSTACAMASAWLARGSTEKRPRC
jgi:Sulfatase